MVQLLTLWVIFSALSCLDEARAFDSDKKINELRFFKHLSLGKGKSRYRYDANKRRGKGKNVFVHDSIKVGKKEDIDSDYGKKESKGMDALQLYFQFSFRKKKGKKESQTCYKCFKRKGSPVSPLSPVSPMTPTIVPAPSPQPPAANPNSHIAGCFGDPHISTFDQLRFSCQAAGVFTTVTSLETPNFRIQEIFRDVGSDTCSHASVSTGVAIQEPGLPLVQVSIPGVDAPDAETINSCPVDLFVNRIRVPLSAGTGDSRVVVGRSGRTVAISFTNTQLVVELTVQESVSFNCFISVQVRLPFTYRQNETILGLWGTPNFELSDDWRSPDGTIIDPPQTREESIFGPAYNYCVENWCVRDSSESLFSFRSGETFDDINRCDVAYNDDIEEAVASVGSRIRDLCGGSLPCLVDGACGLFEDAVAALAAEEELRFAQEQIIRTPSPSAPSVTPTSSLEPSFSFVP